MKKILLLVAMLSIMLFSVGSVYAVVGVADDVPGTDTVFPFICEKGGTMNTLWAIGDVVGGYYTDPLTGLLVPGTSAEADLLVFNKRSTEVYDDRAIWTPFDIVNSDCQTLIAGMAAAQVTALGETVIGGKTYYIGYIVYFNDWPSDDRFVNWVYLVDLPKGFASGFNGFSVEGVVTLGNLEENGSIVSASALYPRFFILNANADTWNWWIILKGENSVEPVTYPASFPNGYHRLSGSIYNEEECGISMTISIPDELSVIDVGSLLPGTCFSGYPKAGMGIFSTVNGLGAPDFDTDFSTFGWAYQRAQSDTVQASWDVIHPMHRDY